MTDEKLVQRFIAGDRQSFVALYKKHVDNLFIYIKSKVANLQLAEDLTQDVFLEACQSLASTKLEKGFAPWIFAIAKNKIRAHWKNHYQMPQISIDQMLQYTDFHESQKAISYQEAEERFLKLLEGLPENQAQVLYLRFYKQYSRKEIATELSVKENTVKVWQYRALKTLSTKDITKGETS